MPRTKTITEFRRDLKQMRAAIKKAFIDPIRIESGIVSKEIRRDVKATDIGRALWGRRRSGGSAGKPALSIKKRRTRISSTEGGIVGGVNVRGMAAMIILGGRTSAHTIKPNTGRLLSLGTNQVVTGGVRHPGSTIHSRGAIVDQSLGRAVKRLEKRLARTIDSVARRTL